MQLDVASTHHLADGTGLALQHRSTRRNKSVIIRGNIVRQCLIGFELVSAATDRFERVVLEGNTFDPGVLPASFAVFLDRNANVIDDFVMANNIWTGAGVVPVARLLKDEIRVPYDGSQLWRTDGTTDDYGLAKNFRHRAARVAHRAQQPRARHADRDQRQEGRDDRDIACGGLQHSAAGAEPADED